MRATARLATLAGAGTLALSLWLPWYGVHRHVTAWQAFDHADQALVVLALLAGLTALTTVAVRQISALAGISAALLIGSRLLFAPHDWALGQGGWLALGGAAAIFLAATMAPAPPRPNRYAAMRVVVR